MDTLLPLFLVKPFQNLAFFIFFRSNFQSKIKPCLCQANSSTDFEMIWRRKQGNKVSNSLWLLLYYLFSYPWIMLSSRIILVPIWRRSIQVSISAIAHHWLANSLLFTKRMGLTAWTPHYWLILGPCSHLLLFISYQLLSLHCHYKDIEFREQFNAIILTEK